MDLNGDGTVHLSEMKSDVQSEVFKLSGGKQSPTSRIKNITYDFEMR